MGWRLIQKGIIKDTKMEDIVGIDSLIQIRDMYYAEYEFGALPTSLKRMAKNMDNMSFEKIKINKSKNVPYAKCVTIYGDFRNPETKEQIIADVKLLAKEKLSTKGYSYFPKALSRTMDYEKPNYPMDGDCDFWWDIENDFMFFLGNELDEFQPKLVRAFEKLQEKWKEELFPPKPKTFVEKLFGK